MAKSLAKPPDPLDLVDSTRRGDNWKQFKRDWSYYETAAKIDKEDGPVRVAHLLNVIGKDGQDMFDTFALEGDDRKDITKVLQEFETRCTPVTNVIYERYVFNKRTQQPGETLDHYLTAIIKQADRCQYAGLKDEFVRDRLVSGILSDQAREKLLSKTDLTLAKAIKLLKSNEATHFQAQDMAVPGVSTVQTVNTLPQKKLTRRVTGNDSSQKPCRYCGRRHAFKREACPAFDKECLICKKRGHFARQCRSSKAHYLEDENSDDEEAFFIHSVRSSTCQPALVTCTVNDSHKVTFEIDTGASCNILPLSDYIKATGDKKGTLISPTKTRLTMHNNSKATPMGKVMLPVERSGQTHRLRFFVMKSSVMPILGKGSSIGMRLIQILDCDSIHSVTTDTPSPSDVPANLRDPIFSQYSDVFRGLGKLPGEYMIQTKPDNVPVVNPPRRLPVSLRGIVKAELDAMVDKQIISPVTEPTPWVSSMVVAQKKDGKVRICLDPQHLNKAIMRSHYPLPTIEEVTTRLTDAKVFSVLDAKTGFWQVQLTDKSSYLTTFNTPFGRYRWRRMPFGISSAPEVWQQKMHEIVEGLSGVEVIADDFLICGFGATKEQATANHDTNLCVFLDRARERGLKLNPEKAKLRLSSVPFIGHLLTDKGLAPDPLKISAILNMPTPTNVKTLQQFLGMTQYLAKFLPQLSVVTEPLRQLSHKDASWDWLPEHDTAISTVKKLICNAPVLRYFDPTLPVTLQCDASEGGLGYALLQQGQPVAFGARGLTQTERNYAQIEKEMLAIVCACEKFDQFVYGQKVTVETDHKPLVSIALKPIHSSPKRLQRMLLRLQRYDLIVTYRKGSEMYLADALSRAYPAQSVPLSSPQSEFCHLVEAVDLTEHLPISSRRLKQIQEATNKDSTLQILKHYILSGWPNNKTQVPSEVRPYVKCHDELSIQDDVLFKGSRIIVPALLRKELIQRVHDGHLGVESCLRRAREVMYWPLLNSEIKDYVSNCSVCNALQPAQTREPLTVHEIPERPWSKVATDLFSFNGGIFLVTVDYFSNYIEIDKLRSQTSQAVIKALQAIFSRHGIPDTVVSDNGPAYASEEFSNFAATWEFHHVTTSPHYPQSNGKAESAVKICKNLLKKAKLAKSNFNLALLNHRNTPTEPTNLSPAQRLFGRRTRTLLPTTNTLLKPKIPQQVPVKLRAGQQKQAEYFNKKAKSLQPLSTGDTVRVRLPGSTTWSLGLCKNKVAPRSYLVECNGTVYRRNRQHIRKEMTCTQDASGWNDFTSDIDEEDERDETETQAISNVPVEPGPSDNHSQPTSSFGRILKPTRRYIETET